MNDSLIWNDNNIIFYEDIMLLLIYLMLIRAVITRHINNIYNDNELEKISTCAKNAHMGNNGKQSYNTNYYNLNMIVSIGFRVNSKTAI